MNKTRYISKYVIFSLIFSIIIPIHAAEIKGLKKTLSDNVNQLVMCIKNPAHCKPEVSKQARTKIINATIALLTAFGILATGAAIYYWRKKKDAAMPQPKKEKSDSGELPKKIETSKLTKKISDITYKFLNQLENVSLTDLEAAKSIDAAYKNKIDLNSQNFFKRTPLIIAAYKNYVDAVKKLLQYNVNLDIQDTVGKTALIYAAEKGHREIVDMLLAQGANQRFRTIVGKFEKGTGKTALDLAQKSLLEASPEQQKNYQYIIEQLQKTDITD
jgi:hypothetical protein